MDIAEQISSLLNSPDGMERLRSVAEGLLGGEQTKSAPPQSELPMNLPNMLSDAGNAMNIMRIMSLINQNGTDQRAALLLALKPHLGAERQKRVDRAVSFLKIASILPILKSEGILDNLI